MSSDVISAWISGLDYKLRYDKLLSGGEGVFTRSAGGERVVETGQYWLEGFSENRFRLRHTDMLPKLDVVMPESDVSQLRRRSELTKRPPTTRWQCIIA